MSAMDTMSTASPTKTVCHTMRSLADALQSTLLLADELFGVAQSAQGRVLGRLRELQSQHGTLLRAQNTAQESSTANTADAASSSSSSLSSSSSGSSSSSPSAAEMGGVEAAIDAARTREEFTLSATFTDQSIMEEVNTWLDTCVAMCHQHVPSVLHTLTQGRQLGMARDAVLRCLTGDSDVQETGTQPSIDDDEPEDEHWRVQDDVLLKRARWKEHWIRACHHLLGRSVNIWDEVFGPAFQARVKQVITAQFEELTLHAVIDRALTSLDAQVEGGAVSTRQISSNAKVSARERETQLEDKRSESPTRGEANMSYVALMDLPSCSDVSDEDDDVPLVSDDEEWFSDEAPGKAKDARISGAHDDQQEDRAVAGGVRSSDGQGGLWHKEVLQTCDAIEKQLNTLVHDIEFLLDESMIRSSDVFDSLHRFVSNELRPFVQRSCSQAVSHMVTGITSTLSQVETAILGVDEVTGKDQATVLVHKGLFIARVCSRLIYQSKALKALVTLEAEKNTTSSSSSSSSSFIASSPRSIGTRRPNIGFSPQEYIQHSLFKTSHLSYHIWTRFVASALGTQLRTSVTQWLIQWGTHTEQPVLFTAADSSASSLPLPVQPSQHVFSFLFQATRDMHRVTGYSVRPEVLGWLLSDLTHSVLTIYEGVVCKLEGLSEAAGFQLLFDVMYLFAVLRVPATPSKPSSKPSGSVVEVKMTEELGIVSTQSDRSRLESLISALEGSLDAINFSVSRDHLRKRVSEAVSRASLVFGTFVKLNPFPPCVPGVSVLGKKAASSAAGSTNITPCAPLSSRLPTVSSYMYPPKNVSLVSNPSLAPPTLSPASAQDSQSVVSGLGLNFSYLSNLASGSTEGSGSGSSGAGLLSSFLGDLPGLGILGSGNSGSNSSTIASSWWNT